MIGRNCKRAEAARLGNDSRLRTPDGLCLREADIAEHVAVGRKRQIAGQRIVAAGHATDLADAPAFGDWPILGIGKDSRQILTQAFGLDDSPSI